MLGTLSIVGVVVLLVTGSVVTLAACTEWEIDAVIHSLTSLLANKQRLYPQLRWGLVPTAVLAVGVTFTAMSPLGQNPASTVTLPIEVIGPDGTVESVAVSASDVSDVDSLYLKTYSIGYPYYNQYDVNKASIRLNGGSWTDLTDAVVKCKYPESQWDCVDGPYHTIRFEVSVDDLGSLQNGSNTIDFRFNYASASNSPTSHGDVSTGYRILDIQFRTGGDQDRIDQTDFVWDDPGSWSAPDGFGTTSDIDAGKKLWHARNTLTEGWGDRQIWASCADCHANDGRDLAYFAFSNHSIVQRSRFHGLSEEEGKQIAAYIRSYVLKDSDTGETYEAPGRPWHPPYQPGPTAVASRGPGDSRESGRSFSELSSQMWSAGAGLEWALKSDKQMWEFFAGTDQQLDYEDVAVDSTLNMRRLPLNLQLPDWNEWLPAHHPMDLFGSTFRDGYSSNSDPWGIYTDVVPGVEDCLSTNGGDATNCGRDYYKATQWLYSNARHFQAKVKDNTISATSRYDDLSQYRRAAEVMKWQASRQWETIHTHDLEDEGEHWHSEVEPLTWIADARQVFDIPPHIAGLYAGPMDGTYDLYLDNAWYQLQVTINSGHGIATGIRPTDWRYQVQHISDLEKHLGKRHATRYVSSFVKVNQNCDSTPPSADDTQPRLWFFRRGHCNFGPALLWNDRAWAYNKVNELTGGQALSSYENVLRANFRGFGKHPKDSWTRKYGESGWEPESFTPSLDDSWLDENATPSHYYKTLDIMQGRGASAALLDSIARWGEEMNPSGDWEQWFSDGSNEPPTVQWNNPENNASFEEPDTLALSAGASDSDGSISSVEFAANGTSLQVDSSSPYEYAWTDVGTGTYTLTATATDDAGAIATDSIEVTVSTSNESTPTTTGVAFEYYEGLWDNLPDFSSLTPVSSGTTDQFDVSPRQRDDEFGLRFVAYANISETEAGTFTFYTTSDDGSRLLVDGQVVVDNDGQHASQERSGTIDLTSGWHKLSVEYFEAGGDQSLSVSWASPAFSRQTIPSSRLFLSPDSTSSQKIPLQAGWNLVSSYIEPSSPELDSVFSDVEHLVVVKNEDGDSYVPSLDVNEIGQWTSSAGYEVYVETADTLAIQGIATDSTASLDLSGGWNILPFYLRGSMSVSTALDSIDTSVVTVKDQDGNSYIPSLNIDNIGDLVPGRGYKIYMETSVTLTYPTN